VVNSAPVWLDCGLAAAVYASERDRVQSRERDDRARRCRQKGRDSGVRERERRSPQRKRARISQIGMGSVVRERLERSTDQARSRS
jgi:hypothetical protein